MANIQENSTKDRIIDAAFSFYKKPQFTNISLSDIAAKAGITKPAIFRHFHSKEDIFNAMRIRFYDDIAELYSSIEPYFKKDSSVENLLAIVVKAVSRMIYEHNYYLGYSVYQFISDVNFHKDLFIGLTARGIKLTELSGCFYDKTSNCLAIKEKDCYFRLVYIMITIAGFYGRRYLSSDFNSSVFLDEQYRKSMVQMILYGISEKTKVLSENQKRELNKLCIINPETMPPKNPLFNALSEVIRKKGFPGTTVESIADEMGLAKSSLYTYFSNKDELIVTLVENELTYLTHIVGQYVKVAHSIEEDGYVMMRTTLEYYRLRPSIVSVAGWLGMRGSLVPEQLFDKLGIDMTKFSEQKKNKADFPMTNEEFYEWMNMLVTVVFFQLQTNGLSVDDAIDAITKYYTYIQKGVLNNEQKK